MTAEQSNKVGQVRGAILAGTFDESGMKLEIASAVLADRVYKSDKLEAPTLPDGFACNDFDGLG